jgi:hypothetical protein
MKKMILAGLVLAAFACNQSKVATDFYQSSPRLCSTVPARCAVETGTMSKGVSGGGDPSSRMMARGAGYSSTNSFSTNLGYGSTGSSSDQIPAKAPAPGIQNQMLIKKASLRFEVKIFQAAKSKLSGMIKASNAYVASERESKSDGELSNTMTIRVPQSVFDNLVDSIAALAKNLDEKNVTVEDVTEEYVDTESRLKAKRQVEIRYLEILTKAQKVKDILEVEENLGSIREEIESAEGRLRYLSHRTLYSTIDLTFYEQKNVMPAVHRTGILWQTFTAFVEGWNGLLDFSLGLVSIWPGLIVIALIIAVIIRIFRKWKKRNEK